MAAERCPVCDEKLNLTRQTIPDHTGFDCPTCGRFELDGSTIASLPQMRRSDPHLNRILSYAIRRQQVGGERVVRLGVAGIESLVASTSAPTLIEQAENLILLLGDRSVDSVGEPYGLDGRTHGSIVGSRGTSGLTFIAEHLISQGLLDSRRSGVHAGGVTATLSFTGWQRYAELKRGRSESRRVLMAMPFQREDVRQAFEVFKPAVKDAGFELYNLGDDHSPGLIDDKLRVAIARSRFLVADLTHGNHGAYWEAGFAEALGKPVIYTCEKAYFRSPGVHFDTGHLHHVLWELDLLGDAAEKLKASIRATAGIDAKMED